MTKNQQKWLIYVGTGLAIIIAILLILFLSFYSLQSLKKKRLAPKLDSKTALPIENNKVAPQTPKHSEGIGYESSVLPQDPQSNSSLISLQSPIIPPKIHTSELPHIQSCQAQSSPLLFPPRPTPSIIEPHTFETNGSLPTTSNANIIPKNIGENLARLLPILKRLGLTTEGDEFHKILCYGKGHMNSKDPNHILHKELNFRIDGFIKIYQTLEKSAKIRGTMDKGEYANFLQKFFPISSLIEITKNILIIDKDVKERAKQILNSEQEAFRTILSLNPDENFQIFAFALSNKIFKLNCINDSIEFSFSKLNRFGPEPDKPLQILALLRNIPISGAKLIEIISLNDQKTIENFWILAKSTQFRTSKNLTNNQELFILALNYKGKSQVLKDFTECYYRVCDLNGSLNLTTFQAETILTLLSDEELNAKVKNLFINSKSPALFFMLFSKFQGEEKMIYGFFQRLSVFQLSALSTYASENLLRKLINQLDSETFHSLLSLERVLTLDEELLEPVLTILSSLELQPSREASQKICGLASDYISSNQSQQLYNLSNMLNGLVRNSIDLSETIEFLESVGGDLAEVLAHERFSYKLSFLVECLKLDRLQRVHLFNSVFFALNALNNTDQITFQNYLDIEIPATDHQPQSSISESLKELTKLLNVLRCPFDKENPLQPENDPVLLEFLKLSHEEWKYIEALDRNGVQIAQNVDKLCSDYFPDITEAQKAQMFRVHMLKSLAELKSRITDTSYLHYDLKYMFKSRSNEQIRFDDRANNTKFTRGKEALNSLFNNIITHSNFFPLMQNKNDGERSPDYKYFEKICSGCRVSIQNVLFYDFLQRIQSSHIDYSINMDNKTKNMLYLIEKEFFKNSQNINQQQMDRFLEFLEKLIGIEPIKFKEFWQKSKFPTLNQRNILTAIVILQINVVPLNGPQPGDQNLELEPRNLSFTSSDPQNINNELTPST